MIRAHVENRIEYEPGISRFFLEVYDEEGNKLSDEQVKEAFMSFNITGICIKSRHKALPEGLPSLAMIVGYTAQHVVLDTGDDIPREEFHALYILD